MGDRSYFRNTKGQVTIFIILAIVIVVLGVLIYAFLPQLRSTVGLETKDPYSFIQSCLDEKIEETVLNLSLQGGSVYPEGSLLYGGNNIEYLCYTSEYNTPCSNQQPFIKNHVEEEIENEIKVDATNCFQALAEDFQNKGYDAILTDGITTVEILPKRILTTFSHELTLRKDSTETYDKFNIIINSNLDEILEAVPDIVEEEISNGNVNLMEFNLGPYPDLDIINPQNGDDGTIYIITDKSTKETFQFALRSWVSPLGLG